MKCFRSNLIKILNIKLCSISCDSHLNIQNRDKHNLQKKDNLYYVIRKVYPFVKKLYQSLAANLSLRYYIDRS